VVKRLVRNSVATEQHLVIPPVSGIVYTIKAGDTAESLAQKFKADKDKIVKANDAESSGFKLGEQIIIPDGTQAATAVVGWRLWLPVGRVADLWLQWL